MNAVTQLDPFGCGAACVSFIVQKEYSQVADLLGRKKAKQSGFYCKDLIAVLSTFGSTYSYRYIKPRLRRKINNEGTIVFIKRSKKYPAGHYLVRSNGKWMDPWINFVKDDEIYHAKSGFRKRLPGKPIYVIFRIETIQPNVVL